MCDIKIKVIPAHIVYCREYEIKDYNDFFDEATGANILADLEELMHSQNPDVNVPEMPDVYNYITHSEGEIPGQNMKVLYSDMVDRKGTDTEQYRFCEVTEITAAVMLHKGPYEKIGETYRRVYEWIEANRYEAAGGGRSSTIDGPWNKESREDYLTEVQIPVRKK